MDSLQVALLMPKAFSSPLQAEQVCPRFSSLVCSSLQTPPCSSTGLAPACQHLSCSLQTRCATIRTNPWWYLLRKAETKSVKHPTTALWNPRHLSLPVVKTTTGQSNTTKVEKLIAIYISKPYGPSLYLPRKGNSFCRMLKNWTYRIYGLKEESVWQFKMLLRGF